MARCKRAMKVVIWAFSSVAKNRRRYPPLLLERCARITMREAGAVGCRASLIGRERPYGKPFESPMGGVDGDMRERKPKFGAPGKLRPAVFALKSPKASAPRLHQRNVGGENLLTGCLPKTQAVMRCGGAAPATPDSKEKPSRRPRRERAHSRFLRSQPRRIGLGSVRQARPRRDEINISWVVSTTTPNRNFLLCWKAELSILP